MKLNVILGGVLLLLVISFPEETLGKKKKSKKNGKAKFDSKTLKCLVCRATVSEYAWAVLRVDPKKMIDTGSWRIDEKGQNKRQIVSDFLLIKTLCFKLSILSPSWFGCLLSSLFVFRYPMHVRKLI